MDSATATKLLAPKGSTTYMANLIDCDKALAFDILISAHIPEKTSNVLATYLQENTVERLITALDLISQLPSTYKVPRIISNRIAEVLDYSKNLSSFHDHIHLLSHPNFNAIAVARNARRLSTITILKSCVSEEQFYKILSEFMHFFDQPDEWDAWKTQHNIDVSRIVYTPQELTPFIFQKLPHLVTERLLNSALASGTSLNKYLFPTLSVQQACDLAVTTLKTKQYRTWRLAQNLEQLRTFYGLERAPVTVSELHDSIKLDAMLRQELQKNWGYQLFQPPVT